VNIPTSLIVVGLVVAWLVVLVPMVARRRERVPQAPAFGAGMRVLRRASASLRRKPRRARAGRPAQGRDRQSGRTEEVLVSVGAGPQHEPTDAAEEWAAAQAESHRPVATMAPPAYDEPQLSFTDEDRGVDEDAPVGDGPVGDGSAGAGFESDAESTVAVDISGTDGADTDGGRPVDHGTIPDEVDEDEWAMETAAASPVPPSRPDGVEDEHLRPVPRRPGRGGYDPEAAEATRAYRYRQRRRITFVLLIATVVFSLAALLTVSVFWVGAVVSVVLVAGYLTYLRRQVRIEAAIRQRRMERLQRARQIRPESGRSRPGRVRSDADRGREVVDLDDDDPGFDDLEQYHEPVTYRRAVGQ
jgi:uncharacterized membrane protein YciS (DUF1049 family)